MFQWTYEITCSWRWWRRMKSHVHEGDEVYFHPLGSFADFGRGGPLVDVEEVGKETSSSTSSTSHVTLWVLLSHVWESESCGNLKLRRISGSSSPYTHNNINKLVKREDRIPRGLYKNKKSSSTHHPQVLLIKLEKDLLGVLLFTKKLIYTKRVTVLITFQNITRKGVEQWLDHVDSEIIGSQVLRADSVLHKQVLTWYWWNFHRRVHSFSIATRKRKKKTREPPGCLHPFRWAQVSSHSW